MKMTIQKMTQLKIEWLRAHLTELGAYIYPGKDSFADDHFWYDNPMAHQSARKLNPIYANSKSFEVKVFGLDIFDLIELQHEIKAYFTVKVFMNPKFNGKNNDFYLVFTTKYNKTLQDILEP